MDVLCCWVWSAWWDGLDGCQRRKRGDTDEGEREEIGVLYAFVLFVRLLPFSLLSAAGRVGE